MNSVVILSCKLFEKNLGLKFGNFKGSCQDTNSQDGQTLGDLVKYAST